MTTALAMAVSCLASAAFADDRPFALPPGNTTPPASAPPNVQPGPVQTARATAKSTGKPVTVDALTTQTSLTVANPDGTLTRTDNLNPARVKKNGTWTPVDATLAKNADGTYSPNATPSGVTLSGGGTSPLAVFTDAAGHSLSLTLPFALPAPTISGNTAQYTGVLPGVDLKVAVTDQGAFREVLVVHDASAAANPALTSLRLATHTNGVTTSADPSGNITAATSNGTVAFSAPTPVMWDSTTATAPTSSPQTAAPNQTAAPATSTGGTAAVDPSDSPTSSADGPGQSAHLAPIKVTADSTGVTLTPDANELTSSGTAWPVYIDPYVNPATGGTNHYIEVQEGCPSSALFDVPQNHGEGIGFQHFDASCYGLYRSFYNFDISNLNASMVVSSSTLYFTETYGADWTCNNSWPVSLALTGPIDKNTAWPGPYINANLGTQNVKSASPTNSCGDRPVNFDVTGTVRQYLTNGNLTFGLYGDERKYSTNSGFMRFGVNPYIQTVFDIAPNTPDQLGTTPAPPGGPACGSGTPGWIGNSGTTGGKSNIYLNARVSTPMSGVNLYAQYHVWDNMANNGSGSPADVSWPLSPWVASGTPVYTNINAAVSDGHQYGWNVWASDGGLNSASSAYCYFNVDLTPPTVPSIAPSAVFPPLGSANAPSGHAGDAATVHVTATDPTPTGCSLSACISSGVGTFQYSIDTSTGGNTVPATTDANGLPSADIPITVTQWGTHTLYVRATDNAGNTQATTATYSFYAPWNPNSKVTPGDLTGDGVPDLLATSTDGNLTLIPGNSDPAASATIASTPAQSPDQSSWNNYLIAHRGSVAQGSVDDLFAYNKSNATHAMYVYKNDITTSPTTGTPGHFTNSSAWSSISRPSCQNNNCTGYDTTGWSAVTQVVAPGSLSNTNHRPDLITVENGKPWYFKASAAGNSYFAGAYLIGTGDWSNTTLIAPGTIGATVANGTTTGGTPTLWARNNTTGAISSYPLTFDSSGNPTTSIPAPIQAPLTSGLKDGAGNQMCLDINGANTANGTQAQVFDCNNGTSQSFTLGADNTIHALGKCLDVNGAGTTAGTLVQLWDCNNGLGQQWIPGTYPGSLKNPHSGLCLNTPGSNPNPGTQLTIDTCGNTSGQQWAATTTGNTLPATQPVLPLGISSHDYPAIASPGDTHGTGNPDLYTITAGQITDYPGLAPSSAGIAQFGAAKTVSSLTQPTDRWMLTDVADAIRPNNLTVGTGAVFAQDSSSDNRGTVLKLPGTTGASAATGGQILDTTKSYTISAWAYLTSVAGHATIVGQSGSNASAFYLQYSKSLNAWTFISPSSDSTGPASYSAAYASAPPTLNSWTHLVATYDASLQTMSLYINGNLISTATNTSPWASSGPLTIGASKTGDPFPGMISDVQTWNSALSPIAVDELNSTRPTPVQLS